MVLFTKNLFPEKRKTNFPDFFHNIVKFTLGRKKGMSAICQRNAFHLQNWRWEQMLTSQQQKHGCKHFQLDLKQLSWIQ